MNTKLAVGIVLVLTTLVLALAACQGDSVSPNATTTVSSGKQPNSSVSGAVAYRERLALTPGARLEVQLRYTSYQDAASELIAEQVIENPGQVPIEFRVEYNRDDIDDRNTYSLQARIVEADGRLAFTNDTAYDVITRGNPRRVDMLLVMVQPPSVDGSDGEAVGPNEWVEAEYPVVGADMLPPHEGDFLRIFFLQSELENCSRRRDQSVQVEGNDILVALTHYVPPPAPWGAPCDEHLIELDEVADLNGKLEAGVSYTVSVNGVVTNSFSRPSPDFPHSVIEPADVIEAEVQTIESGMPQYNLRVAYGIPAGSGCSQENGYRVSRREPGIVEVKVTYHGVAQGGEPVICITDYPVTEVIIPLGSDFEAGQDYAVIVNGEEATTFTVR